jgi:hypothetical protein
MTEIYKTKGFARYARRERLNDAALCEAVERANRGIVDADLGQGVIKQRVARPGQGRSGGFRVILFYRLGNRVVFVEGFSKNEKSNITADELKQLRKLAITFLSYSPTAVTKLVQIGEWIEVICDGTEIP